ncbi:hypothetical protein BGHDH14_bgh01773 [Blumeria hordei DH14]|uniref:Pre-mRNA-splicing factor 38B n=1 Tax=Blumeria graminis f. sp. hordei (strain DH14) TaxID=546991 RepID=N1JIG5_BLUG1|nr:hypothetical protein BGHDH14_bgh01773 [Blumeria hordei DH14]
MSNYEIFTDDYVADLLAKDAKERSIRYSSIGMKAFASSKPDNKPKPNTRFLRNIIKDTDNHNAALLIKEASEARERLRGLSGGRYKTDEPRGSGERVSQRHRHDEIYITPAGSKKRHHKELLTPSKSYISNEDREFKNNKKSRKSGNENPSLRDEDEKPRVSRDRRFRGILDVLEERKKSEDKRKRRRSRSCSPRESCSRRQERSPSKRTHRSVEIDLTYHRTPKSYRYQRIANGEQKNCQAHGKNSVSTSVISYDSDPLEEIIGPLPAPKPELRTRGRGTISRASGIDSHFSTVYDPKTDVQLDSDEENDWDQALEALQDRQKFKEKGIERLRAAGFTEKELMRLDQGGEKREEDFKWAMPGEDREWDRGKVVNSEGIVGYEPKFGRIKDFD